MRMLCEALPQNRGRLRTLLVGEVKGRKIWQIAECQIFYMHVFFGAVKKRPPRFPTLNLYLAKDPLLPLVSSLVASYTH